MRAGLRLRSEKLGTCAVHRPVGVWLKDKQGLGRGKRVWGEERGVGMGQFRVDVKGKGCRVGSTWSVPLDAPGTVVNVRVKRQTRSLCRRNGWNKKRGAGRRNECCCH